jgi:predicted nucleic-acid-binding Zn-ribbon protein
MIEYYNFDTSHFLDLNGSSESVKLLDDQSDFTYGKAIKSEKMKNHLVHLRGHQCEKCGNTEWMGQPIPLETHHIDGDRLNNTLDNLQLLCPNCHAQTENYRNKNISIEKEKRNTILDEDFIQALQTSKNIRQALLKLGLVAKGGNYTRANEIIAKYNIRLGESL